MNGKKDVDKTRNELLRELNVLRDHFSRLKVIVQRYEKVASRNKVFLDNSNLEALKEEVESLRKVLPDRHKDIDSHGEEMIILEEELSVRLDEINAREMDIALANEEHRKVAEAKEAERKRLFDVLETLPAMICLLTPDYHVVFANRSFREKFGESRGRHCYEYCFGRAEPCEFCESYKVLETGLPHHWEVTGPDGSVIDVHDLPFTDTDGSSMILEMDIDITKRKRAEEAVNAAKEQSELYLDLMGHDISNMHQIIMGNLEIAQDVLATGGKLDNSNKEIIDNSMATLQRSARLISNIRNIQKMRSGELRFDRMDLGDVLEETIKGYTNRPGRDISIDYRPAHGCYVMANPLIKDIFNNLVDNAVKHCKDPVRICLNLAPARLNGSHYYRVVVEDNGPGVPDEMKTSIFSRTKRGKSITMGTGLGLYIVKTLVEGFDGTINVDDRVQGDHTNGARFVVMLPAIDK